MKYELEYFLGGRDAFGLICPHPQSTIFYRADHPQSNPIRQTIDAPGVDLAIRKARKIFEKERTFPSGYVVAARIRTAPRRGAWKVLVDEAGIYTERSPLVIRVNLIGGTAF